MSTRWIRSATAFTLVLAACGGTGDSTTTARPTPVATTEVTTTVAATTVPPTTTPPTTSEAPTTSAGPVDSVTGGIPGVVVYDNLAQDHVEGAVAYEVTPPVGGPHAGRWLTCAFYPEAVPNENAVHSLEHGAVWVTFDPNSVDASGMAVLEGLADLTFGDDPRAAWVLVSPYPGIPAPVVASAWGRQLLLEGVEDPRLGAFLLHFANGPQNPEPGAPC